jgi:LacI family transcriptional regulator
VSSGDPTENWPEVEYQVFATCIEKPANALFTPLSRFMRESAAIKTIRRHKRVLLALGWYDYRLHRGIARYAEEHGWHLCPDTTKEKVIPWGWEGDGILAWLGAGDDLAEFVVKAKKPTVDFSYRRSQLQFPRVLADHEAAAKLSAEHFLARGLSNYLMYSDANNWAFEENGRAFVKAVAHTGRTCKWLRWHKSHKFARGRDQWRLKRRWLAEELKQAPKPLAVFATTDDHAVEVLEACEDLGLTVPDQVSIVGVDNSLLAVDSMHTPISSVDTNLELVGYRGAELLDELMRGRKPPAKPIRIPPTGLIVRKSSDLIAVNHAGVAKSLRFMMEHCHEAIGVDDMARAAGMSRRALHQAFRKELGRAPGAELHRTRIELARKLLRKSDQKLETIAEMCGYQSSNSLWVAFKKATGMTPSHFRQSSRG